MKTAAECLRRIFLFEKPEYIPNFENAGMGPRLEQQWHTEGLPAGVSIDNYFGFVNPIHWYGWIGRGKFDPFPGVQGQGVIAEDDHSTTYRDCWGRETQWFKDEMMSENAHRVLKEGVVNRADWQKFIGHFDRNDPWRYPGSVDPSRTPVCLSAIIFPPARYQGEITSFADLEKMAAAGETLLQITAPSMFGELKEMMGYENLCRALFDDRPLVKEIIDTRTDLALAVINKVMDRIPFSILHFWEDMAYQSGPLINPKVFAELAGEAYTRIIELFKSKGGQIVSLDSDGDIRKLIPLWIQCGVNHLWPMEVKSGLDVVALRKQYGRAFSMRGGIDKFILFDSPDAMRRELERIAPVAEDGGYMPMIDHSVPPGVSFENFCRYMELKQEILGVRYIPWEQRE